jgi:hypothetical protein
MNIDFGKKLEREACQKKIKEFEDAIEYQKKEAFDESRIKFSNKFALVLDQIKLGLPRLETWQDMTRLNDSVIKGMEQSKTHFLYPSIMDALETAYAEALEKWRAMIEPTPPPQPPTEMTASAPDTQAPVQRVDDNLTDAECIQRLLDTGFIMINPHIKDRTVYLIKKATML